MRQHHPAFAHSTPGGPSAAALLGTAALSTTADSGGGRAGHPRDERLVNTVSQTSRSTAWKHTGTTDLKFKAFHPQATEVDGDELGEGHIHHPGGIDVDEESIWVPVAEHRPDSRAIVYRIDRDTLEVTEVFRVDDHVGGIVHDRDRHRLVGLAPVLRVVDGRPAARQADERQPLHRLPGLRVRPPFQDAVLRRGQPAPGARALRSVRAGRPRTTPTRAPARRSCATRRTSSC